MSEFLSVSEMPVPGTVVELLLRDGSVIQTLVGQIDASQVRGWRPVAVFEKQQESPVVEEPTVEETLPAEEVVESADTPEHDADSEDE